MLNPLKLTPFTHGEIKPTGWLLRQLTIQAEGLSGHLDKVWPDIRESQWIGGDREGWERVPYWLDGFIPLAYLLNNDDLKARAKRYVDGILAGQDEDGWICPCPPEARSRYDMWACILIVKVLAMYADLSGDERIPSAVERALKSFKSHLRGCTLFNWSSARWFECLIAIYWLYEKTGDEWLIEFAYQLEAQGIDWKSVFEPYKDQNWVREWTYTTHVVNLAMALKQDALVSRLRGGDPDAFANRMHETLLKYHGMAVGHFTGDECVAGDSPIQGSELCSVAEAMYSFEQLLTVGGNPHWGDALERLAFNALPATISKDMWTHQYVQMTNQVQSSRLEKDHIIFGTNNEEAHLFGLEPHFGCCTANFNQAWPKLAMSTFMKSVDGLYSCVLAPSGVRFTHKGVPVSVDLETQYPFRSSLKYTVRVDRPIWFTLYIRIPEFVKSATVNGCTAEPGSFYALDQEWLGEQQIAVEFEFATELIKRPRDMYCVWRGPLMYSVKIVERFEKREYVARGVERKFPYCDYEIYPESDWNYGFASDDFDVHERKIGDYPFDPDNAPVYLTAQLAPIDWPMEHGACLPTPNSREAMGEARGVTMIPYGCTHLRMTEMPKVN